MKIYLVCEVDYEECYHVGVFLDRAAAEMLADNMGKNSTFYTYIVEEHDVLDSDQLGVVGS